MPEVFEKPEKPKKSRSKSKNSRQIGTSYMEMDMPEIPEQFEEPLKSAKFVDKEIHLRNNYPKAWA